MTADVNPLQWSKTLSLDRHNTTPVLHRFLDIPPESTLSTSLVRDIFIDNAAPRQSYLYSARLKQNLSESRKAFLNLPKQSEEVDGYDQVSVRNTRDENVLPDQKKTPSRKISFKIKKTSSIYKKTHSANVKTLSATTVSQLTSKFNQMVMESNPLLEERKFARLVRRVNSQRNTPEDSKCVVIRKPSIKTKPNFLTEERFLSQKIRPSIRRKVSVKPAQKNDKSSSSATPADEQMCVRAKIGFLETTHTVNKPEQNSMQRISSPNSVNLRVPSVSDPSTDTLNRGSVRAAIEIFEKRTISKLAVENKPFPKEVPKIVPKPKVPVKSAKVYSKNDSKKLKVLEKQSPDEDEQEIKTEAEEVQILNLPYLPPRRCDSMYEQLNIKKTRPLSAALKTAKSEEIISSTRKLSSLEVPAKPNNSFLWRRKSQEYPVPGEYNAMHFVITQENPQEADEYILPGLKNPSESKNTYDIVEPKDLKVPEVPPRPNSLTLKPNKPHTPPKKFFKKKMPLPEEPEGKIYEELPHRERECDTTSHGYEYCDSPPGYEVVESKSCDDGYEYCESTNPVILYPKEDIYETLPSPPPSIPRRQEEPLPPRPPSRGSYYTMQNGENVSNCYESIYNTGTRTYLKNSGDGMDVESNYETIYGCQVKIESWDSVSNRDSLLSCDQQSNSLYERCGSYNGKASSELSTSDRSEDWVDLSDHEDPEKENTGIIIIRERPKNKKNSTWSQKQREQWDKSPKKRAVDPGGNSDSDHHYESLYNAQRDFHRQEDFDSFESDTESESSFTLVNQNDSGVDMGNSQLPDLPNNQVHSFTRLAASAGKHMKRLRRNWSHTKNDITKSLSRMTKKKSRTNTDAIGTQIIKEEKSPVAPGTKEVKSGSSENSPVATRTSAQYQNFECNNEIAEQGEIDKARTNSLSRNKFLDKIRRSMSMSAESASELTQSLENKPKSTFYLTETINIDATEDEDSGNVSLSPPISKKQPKAFIRPQSPPPPLPDNNKQNLDLKKANKKDKRATSWYAECGLFKNTDNTVLLPVPARQNTCWYAEVGLYQTNSSTPSTSSAENSGTNSSTNIKSPDLSSLNQSSDEYYNLKNESNCYNHSLSSFSSSDMKIDQTFISCDAQLNLEDEPLYQFYDAAVLESVCQDGISDSEYDGYEEVGNKRNLEIQRSNRPSAMQLVVPSKNGVNVTKTLWCEIPEVKQSAVLSTLSSHQKKLQEAKFEILTSEASYLNSLNVLTNHFITHINNSDCLTLDEKELVFGKVQSVKCCSEKLLSELEKCWQENILLHGVCDIVQKHAEENFYVYVSFCENQILLDSTLRQIKERVAFIELLRQLELNSACQSLTLYSFLMLPMQRITRFPLLVDAVLKRLSPQDDEYLTCQRALATINKIVGQCNEGARKVERETEMKKIATQIEFSKGVNEIRIVSGTRWLVRSGSLTQMVARGDDVKLTFGRRFTKVPVYLFLFNDLLLVTKYRSENYYLVLHHCPRGLIELNAADTLNSMSTRDFQGRHLLFLTILENHDGKTVEMLLSCNSVSDKERWTEALSPPKSDDPDEILYECWDCPQVTAIHNYTANQPDELALSRGDIVNVTRKMADGWYHGERIRDGETGWFPANYTIEIANPHVRARNLKQRYRLLAFSENYLKSK